MIKALLSLLFLDIAIYYLVLKKNSILMLLASFLSIFFIQLLDLYQEWGAQLNIHFFLELIAFMLAIAYAGINFFLARKKAIV